MKTINFDTFKNYSKQLTDNTKLFILIGGIRGAGKSTVIGTLNKRTLLIASTLEAHAVQASKLYGGDNISAILYDVDENQRQVKPDAAMANLHSYLDFLISSDDLLSNYDAIALDSMSAIDKTLLETTRIVQEKNGFEQMKIIEQEHFRVIRKLKELHRKGLHVIATMPILATFDEDGFYHTVSPEIRGITTTSNISGIFDDVVVIAKPDNEHLFQMNLMIKKTGKAMNGVEKKLIFKPRITGLSDNDILSISPDAVLPADLSYIYQLKLAKKKGK